MVDPVDRGQAMMDSASSVSRKYLKHLKENHNKDFIKQYEPFIKLFVDLIFKLFTKCCECPKKYEEAGRILEQAQKRKALNMDVLMEIVFEHIENCDFKCRYTEDMDTEEVTQQILEKIK